MPEYQEKGNFTMLGTFEVNTRQYGEFKLTYRVTTRENLNLTSDCNYGQNGKITNTRTYGVLFTSGERLR